MTNLLILDTASPRCWVGLRHAGGSLVERSSESRRAAQQLLPMTETLLQTAGLTLPELAAIAVINGPGSFTGMRIGVGIAQGLAYAAKIPVITISSLQALAASAAREHGHRHWLVAEAARDGETYFGGYQVAENGHCLPLIPDQIIQELGSPVLQSLPAFSDQWGVAGSNADWLCAALQDAPLIVQAVPSTDISADSIFVLAELELAAGNTTPPEATLPHYVKEQLDYS